ncbi:MAG: adenosylcobinamide-GDP ribazoletransferase [Deltaproteobacteria bacterium]|jgi:adenosylcobinamide-GDP ribazoletransferase|nr:adenosylcobinamide-GDP ribazoletransferase [Deltaproteobacteria bacterium]
MKIVSPLRNAVAFLTILPVGEKGRLSPADFGRLPAYYPAAGLVLGFLLLLFFKLLKLVDLSFGLSAILVTALLIILTRGFHLDGLADSMDALFSHKSREEMLLIMKDSHQGTFGVLAIVLDCFLKASLLESLLQRPDYWAPLLLFPVWGRLSSSTVSAFSRYARAGGGLARHAVELSGFGEFLTAFGLTLVISLACGFPAFLTALAVFLLSLVLVWLWEKALRGVTGDLLGAGCEICEIFSLFFYLLFF